MGLDMGSFKQYVNNLKSMQADFKTWLKNWITKEGYITLADIKTNTPVDTGNLRNGWILKDVYITNNEAGFTVYNGVQEYASIIEYGTPRRPNWKWADGAHMMTNGIYKELDKIPESFDREFTKFLRSKGLA